MVELKYKPLTWPQKRDLLKTLENNGVTFRKLAEDQTIPVDFIEKAFLYGVEGFEDINKLAELDYATMIEGAAKIFETEILNPQTEKKS